MENVGKGIANLPAFCYPGLQIEVPVFAHQGIEEQLVDALRLCISANARIEIRRAGFDEQHDCCRVRTRVRTAEHGEHQEPHAKRASPLPSWCAEAHG